MPDYSEADAVMAAQTGTQTGLTPRSMASEADAVMAAQTGVWGCGEEVAHSTPAVNAFVRNGGDDYRRLQARAAALETSVRLSGDPSRRRDVAYVLEVARRIEAYLMGDK